MHSADAASEPRRHGRTFGAVAIAALGLALGACTTAGYGIQGQAVNGYSVVEPEIVPSQIENYPRTHYRGRYAYLVEDRWYYPTQSGWVVFREEPRELSRYRVWYYDRYGRNPPYSPRRPELGAPP